MPRPRSAGSYIDEQSRLVTRARALLRLERLVLGHLEPLLAGRCRVANLRGGVLVLQTDSAVWATRLRHSAPALLSELKRYEELSGIQRITITIEPRIPPKPAPRRASLSPDAAAHLDAAADATEDPALSKALRRLARRAT